MKTLFPPDSLPYWCGFGAFLLFMLLFPRRNKYGQLADGRMAFDRERKAAVKKAIDRVKKPSAKRAALYIAEPIGCQIPNANNILNFKGELTPVIDINRGTLVVGNQGSGKSESVINQLLKSAIAQGFGILNLDLKYGEQAQELIPFAIAHGYQVSILAPGFPESACCNILDAIENEFDNTTSDQVVYTIRENLSAKTEDRDPFFDPGGEGMVSGAMLLAKWIAKLEGKPHIADLVLVDVIVSSEKLSQRLRDNKEKIPFPAYRSFATFLTAGGSDEKNNTEGSLQAVANSIMKPLVSSQFIDVITGKPDFPCFDPERPFWIGEKQLVILGVSQELRSTVLPLLVTILQQLGSYNLSAKRKREQPLVIGLDEFAAIKLPVVLEDWLPEKRSAGASVIIGLQYIAQVIRNYGEQGANIIFGIPNKFIGSPGSVKNAKDLCDEWGEKEVIIPGNSRSKNGGQHPSNSSSESDQVNKVAVLDPLMLKQFPQGQFVVDGVAVSNGKKGTDERVGIPYVKRFARLNDIRSEQEETSARIFSQMVESVIKGKADRPAFDMTTTVKYYRELVDKYLPIAVANAPAKKSTIALDALLDIATKQGYEFEGQPSTKSVPVPAEWKQPFTLDQVIQLLDSIGLKILQVK